MLIIRIGLVVGLAFAVIGCSSSNAPGKVRGTITYKGQTVKAGTVYFYFEQGGPYRAEIKSDGSYQYNDIPIGEATVVDQKSPVYSQKQSQIAKGMAKSINEYDAAMGKADPEKKSGAPAVGLSKEKKDELAKVYVKIPKKYTNEKSPLTYTVERGNQTKDFDLTD